MCGYLNKYSERPGSWLAGLLNKEWNRRFFCLYGGTLQYFKTEQDMLSHPRGHIELQVCQVVLQNSTVTLLHNRPWCRQRQKRAFYQQHCKTLSSVAGCPTLCVHCAHYGMIFMPLLLVPSHQIDRGLSDLMLLMHKLTNMASFSIMPCCQLCLRTAKVLVCLVFSANLLQRGAQPFFYYCCCCC